MPNISLKTFTNDIEASIITTHVKDAFELKVRVCVGVLCTWYKWKYIFI